MRYLALLSVVAAFAAIAIASPAIPASAHARLENSTPAVGEVLETSPIRVEIEFTQEVQKITGTYGIDVAQDGGPKVTSGEAVLSDEDRTRMSVELQSSLPAGRYVVTYKNVSDADGDAFEGAYAFYVGREPTEAELALDAELVGEEEGTPTAVATTGATAAASTPETSPTPSDTTAISDNDADSPLVVGFALVVILGVAGAGAWFVFRRRNG